MRQPRDIVVIGGSAGGTEAVPPILEALPADFAGSIFIVLHGPSESPRPRFLADLFQPHACLPTHSARDEQPIEPGHVYVAPRDSHMLLDNGLIRLEASPPEHHFRPSVDVLFKSAATVYGQRVIGVLLTGRCGNDGVAGLWQIAHRGGITIVQDPSDAEFPGMPQAALDNVAIPYVLPLAKIGPTLIELVSAPVGVAGRRPRILIVEDESVVAMNLEQSLKEMGYEVVDWVPTGEAAIEIAERQGADLILMDIRLAGKLTGIETARRIWQKQQIPIVYCTAHADLATLKEVQTTESYGYVVKPFQSPAVRAAVELALARREKERR